MRSAAPGDRAGGLPVLERAGMRAGRAGASLPAG